MPDKEAVITHLMIMHTWAEFALERDLQFFTEKHLENIAQWSDDALKLLKEQEPKPELPVDIRPANERFATMKLGYCPKCGKKINSVDHKNYCGECSQAVKWDDK